MSAETRSGRIAIWCAVAAVNHDLKHIRMAFAGIMREFRMPNLCR